MGKAFPFTRDFDQELEKEAEQGRVKTARTSGPTQEEFDQAVEAARQQGYQEGLVKGLSDGQASEQEKISAQLAAANKTLVETLQPLLIDQANIQKNFEHEAIGVLSDIVQKLLPEVMRTQGRALVLSEIKNAGLHAAGSPWLNVTVHPDIADEVKENLERQMADENSATLVKVTADPNSEKSDVRAFWENGRSNYSLKLLCEKIIDTISNAGNPTSKTVVENNNGQ